MKVFLEIAWSIQKYFVHLHYENEKELFTIKN